MGSDEERQLELCSLAHHSPPAVDTGTGPRPQGCEPLSQRIIAVSFRDRPGDHESLSLTFHERTSQYFSSSFSVFSYQCLHVHSPHLCLLNKVHPSRPSTITSPGKTAFLPSSTLYPSKITLSFCLHKAFMHVV